MPNHCDNHLFISGAKTTVRRFVRENRGVGKRKEGHPLSFERVVMPDAQTNDAQYAAWGTKCDLGAETDCVVSTDGTCVNYVFTTAWCPPETWFKKACEKYPTLSFTLYFWEEASDVAGVMEGERGSAMETQNLSIREAKDYAGVEHEEECPECGTYFNATADWKPDMCQRCFATQCVNCNQFLDTHEDGKCLFGATAYRARDPNFKETVTEDAESEEGAAEDQNLLSGSGQVRSEPA